MKILLLILFFTIPLWAKVENTVLGFSGLVITPTAEILSDGELVATVGRVPRLYADNYFYPNYNRTAFGASMGFMPFLEASFAFVRPDAFTGGVGDRTVALRFKLLNESARRPSLALGFHDFFAVKRFDLEPPSAQHFAALYIVATKQFQLSDESFLMLNTGYGFGGLPADDSYLHGLFAGLQYTPIHNVALLLEYDTVHFNAGIRFDFFSHVHYTMSFWQLNYMMHQLGFSINLK